MSNKLLNRKDPFIESRKKSREIDQCLLNGESFYDACQRVLAEGPIVSQKKTKSKGEDLEALFLLLDELNENPKKTDEENAENSDKASSALEKLSQLYKKKPNSNRLHPQIGIDRYRQFCEKCINSEDKMHKQKHYLFNLLRAKGVEPDEARRLAVVYSNLISNHKEK